MLETREKGRAYLSITHEKLVELRNDCRDNHNLNFLQEGALSTGVGAVVGILGAGIVIGALVGVGIFLVQALPNSYEALANDFDKPIEYCGNGDNLLITLDIEYIYSSMQAYIDHIPTEQKIVGVRAWSKTPYLLNSSQIQTMIG